MKTSALQLFRISALFFLILISINSEGQIKVFSNGDISIGTTASPYSKMHVYGNALFSDNTFISGSPLSAALIRGLGDYSLEYNPDYTWWGDDGTGIFHPALNSIGFSSNAAEVMRITDLGNLTIGGSWDNNDYRVKIHGHENKAALCTFTNFNVDWAYAHVSYVNNESTKNWAV